MSRLTDCLSVADDVTEPGAASNDRRDGLLGSPGLLGITGKVPTADTPLPTAAMDDEIGAVGGAEIFRPITGGAGRPMLRMNVLIWSVRRVGCWLSTTTLLPLHSQSVNKSIY